MNKMMMVGLVLCLFGSMQAMEGQVSDNASEYSADQYTENFNAAAEQITEFRRMFDSDHDVFVECTHVLEQLYSNSSVWPLFVAFRDKVDALQVVFDREYDFLLQAGEDYEEGAENLSQHDRSQSLSEENLSYDEAEDDSENPSKEDCQSEQILSQSYDTYDSADLRADVIVATERLRDKMLEYFDALSKIEKALLPIENECIGEFFQEAVYPSFVALRHELDAFAIQQLSVACPSFGLRAAGIDLHYVDDSYFRLKRELKSVEREMRWLERQKQTEYSVSRLIELSYEQDRLSQLING